MSKRELPMNVYEAALERLRVVFDRFERVYLSFSGGKDSSVMLHLALKVARERGRLPLDVLVVDLEAQYRSTMDHVAEMLAQPGIRAHWVCLPIHLRNATSSHQPHWLCWDPGARDMWVRELPAAPGVVSDESAYPFFRRGMEFEEFVPAFGEWFAGGQRTCCLVGIRADESLNRFRTLKNDKKSRLDNLMWTTQVRPGLFNAYPIYDWATEDIWTANARFGWSYNRIYDLMQMAGVPLSQQRICQPYGDDQRRGLWLFHLLEPETWGRVVARVSGANFGALYCGGTILGNRTVELPAGHTWRSYAQFLLDSMPPVTRSHFQKKIEVFLRWWADHGMLDVPDTADPNLEAQRKAPSWRRIAKALIKNDYWCKSLSFSQTKREMERQDEVRRRYAEI
jgi:predicted phosphoadenosine phosphosulfate sulfurtransferase